MREAERSPIALRPFVRMSSIWNCEGARKCVSRPGRNSDDDIRRRVTMADASVAITAGSGTAIDVETVTTGAGTVNRQIVGIGDPGTGGNRLAVNASGQIGINNLPAAAALADGAANPTTPLIGSNLLLWNGTTWDRYANNQRGTLLASASRTVTTASPTQTNYNARGVIIYINITAITGGPGIGLTPYLVQTDPVSGAAIATVSLLAANITTVSTKVIQVYPGVGNPPGGQAAGVNWAVGRLWYVQINVGDATPYTYSVGYETIV